MPCPHLGETILDYQRQKALSLNNFKSCGSYFWSRPRISHKDSCLVFHDDWRNVSLRTLALGICPKEGFDVQSKSYTSQSILVIAASIVKGVAVGICLFRCKQNVTENSWWLLKNLTRGGTSLIILKQPVKLLSTVTHGLGKHYFDQCWGWVNKKFTVFFASLRYQPGP
jgi:hypothetical protein